MTGIETFDALLIAHAPRQTRFDGRLRRGTRLRFQFLAAGFTLDHNCVWIVIPLGQAHHVRGLGDLNLQLVTRASTQLPPNPLLAIKNLSIGGRDTVQGYRENQRVRDYGLGLSLELRIPLLFDAVRVAARFTWHHFSILDMVGMIGQSCATSRASPASVLACLSVLALTS